jgi:hypothetical protein
MGRTKSVQIQNKVSVQAKADIERLFVPPGTYWETEIRDRGDPDFRAFRFRPKNLPFVEQTGLGIGRMEYRAAATRGPTRSVLSGDPHMGRGHSKLPLGQRVEVGAAE